ncbi:MAG: hypothetical protein RLZ98_863 [Pseudomonadota bacterium]|jgi:hypothetical protein
MSNPANPNLQKALIAAALASGLSVSDLAAEPLNPAPRIPSEQAQALLVYSTMAALHNAHVTGNYTVLRDLASPQFANVNSAAHLAEIFSGQRKAKINLGPVLLYQPMLEKAAFVDNNGHLNLQGFFDTKPMQVKFHLSYQWTPVGWRVFGINVAPVKAGS